MLETLRKGSVFSRSYVDYMIGELVEETKTLKLYNDTTIVFWTDHGATTPVLLCH